MNVYFTKSEGARTKTYVVRNVVVASPVGMHKVNVKLKDGTLKCISDVLWIKNDDE